MKIYKQKRKQLDHHNYNSGGFRRNNEFMKTTRLLALDFYDYDCIQDWDWFVYLFLDRIDINHRIEDINMYYHLYKKMCKKLKDNKKKDDFIKESYIPLENDLFVI